MINVFMESVSSLVWSYPLVHRCSYDRNCVQTTRYMRIRAGVLAAIMKDMVVRENGQRNRAGGILYLTTGAVEIGRSAGGWESGWVVEYWGEGENCIG